MAIIAQPSLFSWKQLKDLGDLKQLKLFIDNLSDDALIQKLLKMQDTNRNNYPIQATWNSILAGVIFKHRSIEDLRRELRRNAQLRELCGFDPLKGADAVPPSSAYSQFPTNLSTHQELINDISSEILPPAQKALSRFRKKPTAIKSVSLKRSIPTSKWMPPLFP